jgi:hypothetical protein
LWSKPDHGHKRISPKKENAVHGSSKAATSDLSEHLRPRDSRPRSPGVAHTGKAGFMRTLDGVLFLLEQHASSSVQNHRKCARRKKEIGRIIASALLRDLPSEVGICIAGSGWYEEYGDVALGMWVWFLEPVFRLLGRGA